MKFSFSVTPVPEKRLLGMRVRTNMANAHTDCPALWMRFGPRLCPELLKKSACFVGPQTSYGVSTEMGISGDFTYWAAIEAAPDATSPEGMEMLTIPAGPYVRCSVANLEEVGPAFSAMYMEWPATQTAYAPDMNGLCFELYPPDWRPKCPLELYGGLLAC